MIDVFFELRVTKSETILNLTDLFVISNEFMFNGIITCKLKIKFFHLNALYVTYNVT